jgi:drug/metabolite transporter (DMT)-like permease
VGTKTALLNMLIGLLSHGVWLTCVLFALDRKVPAGIVALIVALQPLATGALSGYVTHEKTNSRQWIGLVIGFVGVVITVGFRINSGDSGSLFGYLIPLASVAAITIATLIQRKIDLEETSYRLPMDLTLFYQSLGTLVAITFPALLAENLATEWKPTFIYTLLWLIVAVSMGAYFLMWRLIEYMEPTKVASLFYLGPPVTMFMGWLAFGDTVLKTDIVGMSVVLVGVILTQRK